MIDSVCCAVLCMLFQNQSIQATPVRHRKAEAEVYVFGCVIHPTRNINSSTSSLVILPND